MQDPLSHGPGASAESAHEAIKADSSLWAALALDGIQHDGRGNLTEFRRCPRCGSLLSRPLSMREASDLHDQQAAMQARSQAVLESARRLLRLPSKDTDETSLKLSSDESAAKPGEEHSSPPIDGPQPEPIDKVLSDPIRSSSPGPLDKPAPQLVVISLRIEGTVQLPSTTIVPKPDAEPIDEATEPSAPPPPWTPDDGWPRTPLEFGLALRQTREHIGLTRAELSEISMVADSTIRNVETNRHKPTASMRRRLIQAMALRGYPRPIGQGQA